MRAITGKYKGRHFNVPASFKARPTTDFAKENLFNVLKAYIDFENITALDLFGGTGSITLEMLSRGAGKVVCVEKDFQHWSFIKQIFRTLNDPNAHILRGDALRYIAKATEPFELIFADPPYALPELAELPDRITSSALMDNNTVFVLEHGKNHDFSSHPCFVEHRSYGSVNFSIFRKKTA
ncbi:MAG: RsmD family RNA methyltransferase [Prevotellaceae bacterium]|nr:RsmD family RNA methyltransferase [Prevotellaceae bacterium]